MIRKPTFIVAVLAMLGAPASLLPSQLSVFKVSKSHDSVDGPSAFPFPGFAGGFRQQLLLSSIRLGGLKGKKLKGLWIRRDLHDQDALVGGSVDLEIRISTATNTPTSADPVFSANVPATQSLVFKGRIVVPNAPKVGSTVTPWSNTNSVRVIFATPFDYQGGALCIDISGRPVVGGKPDFWFIDYEDGSYTGGSLAIGTSCSKFATTSGQTLFTNDFRLQIGSTMRLIALGRPGSSPLMLLGTSKIPGGIDLSLIGATGCRQYINQFLITRLVYTNPKTSGRPASLHFSAQIPANSTLLGTSVFTQFADDELALPVAQRTNRAGLTTSNGLELKISSLAPDLGMSIVTSKTVTGATSMPTSGSVDVSMAPVLRLLY